MAFRDDSICQIGQVVKSLPLAAQYLGVQETAGPTTKER
jgi:hypothetical protein